jgi:hypothetical protein
LRSLKGETIMSLIKISGLVILASSIVFLIAALLPISRVYALSNTTHKLAAIQNAPQAWVISQILFSVGALGVALGVGLAIYSLNDRPMAPWLLIAAVLLAAGALLWSWHVYLRAVDPAAFVSGALPGWQFPLYTLLTISAFLMIGISLRGGGFPTWSTWLLMGGAVLFLVLNIIFKDLPPFAHYLLGLVLGLVLYRAG